jgi:transposase
MGAKLSSITSRLGVPKATAQDWIKTGSTIAKKWSGSPQSLSPRDLLVQQLKRFVKTNRKTHRMSACEIIKDLGFNVSESTLIQVLTQLNLFHRVARQRPFIRVLDKKRRLEYAKKYKHWTAEDWKRVIWTDESSFHIGMR